MPKSETYVIAKCAVSLDGYLDDLGPKSLAVSSREDGAARPRLRSWADAIMIGANTLRRDRPWLLANEETQKLRLEAGRPIHPDKIVLTRTGSLDISAPFFTAGDSRKLVIGPEGLKEKMPQALPKGTDVYSGYSTPSEVRELLPELGINRLLVEGGASILTEWLAADCVDELRIAFGPLILGSYGYANIGNSRSRAPWASARLAVTGRAAMGDVTVIYLQLPGRNGAPILPELEHDLGQRFQ